MIRAALWLLSPALALGIVAGGRASAGEEPLHPPPVTDNGCIIILRTWEGSTGHKSFSLNPNDPDILRGPWASHPLCSSWITGAEPVVLMGLESGLWELTIDKPAPPDCPCLAAPEPTPSVPPVEPVEAPTAVSTPSPTLEPTPTARPSWRVLLPHTIRRR